MGVDFSIATGYDTSEHLDKHASEKRSANRAPTAGNEG